MVKQVRESIQNTLCSGKRLDRTVQSTPSTQYISCINFATVALKHFQGLTLFVPDMQSLLIFASSIKPFSMRMQDKSIYPKQF